MTLSSYHQRFIDLSNEDIEKRAVKKGKELKTIFSKVSLTTGSNPIRVAVLGCADRRLINKHKAMFEYQFNQPIELTTFDITIDHLLGEPYVIQHDCTLPLPNTPYDITYAHVLLKFIETEKQWDVINNSYQALIPGGIAIHVMDKQDYEVKSEKQPDGYFSVPLNRWGKRLDEQNINYKEIPVTYGKTLVLIKP